MKLRKKTPIGVIHSFILFLFPYLFSSMFLLRTMTARNLFHIFVSWQIYSVVCRVATILQARYTTPGFWPAGKGHFEEAERLVINPSEKAHLMSCIAKARHHLPQLDNQSQLSKTRTNRGSRYLFEGHLTVDPELPRLAWLVAQDFLSGIDVTAQSSQAHRGNSLLAESVSGLMEELVNSMGQSFQDLDYVIEASLQEIGAGPPRPPPASKEAVKKLPIITVTEEILKRLGSGCSALYAEKTWSLMTRCRSCLASTCSIPPA